MSYTPEQLRAMRGQSRTNWPQADASAKQAVLNEDDAPELTETATYDLRPASEVLPRLLKPEMAAQLFKKRGRPPKEAPKKLISVRFSHDVLKRFRATGPGWQARMDEALKEWLQTHEHEAA